MQQQPAKKIDLAAATHAQITRAIKHAKPMEKKPEEKPAPTLQLRTVGEQWPEFEAMLAKRADGSYDPISTGLPSLDELLGGGFPRGATSVIPGSPGTGKSSFAAAIALNHARAGGPVIYANLELGPDVFLSRLVTLADETREIRWNAVLTGRAPSAVQAAGELLGPLPIFALHSWPGTLQLAEAVHDLSAQYGQAPLVLIDYAQLLIRTDAGEARLNAEATAAELLELARGTGAAVVLLCSVARQAYGAQSGETDRVLAMSKETGRWESDASVVLGLLRVREGDLAAPRFSKIWAVAAKNRTGGTTGKCPLEFDGVTGRWRELEPEEMPDAKRTMSEPELRAAIATAVCADSLTSKTAIKTAVPCKAQRVGLAIDAMLLGGELVAPKVRGGPFRVPSQVVPAQA